MDLLALADFNLVATHGGFGRASRVSGRSKATLSRRVAELEERLGVRLIERGTHSLRLTEEGRALHTRTEGLLGEIAEVGEFVASGAGTPRGRLRVSSPVVFAHVLMGRLAARFAAQYPEVRLEVTAEDRFIEPVGVSEGKRTELWALHGSRRLVGAKIRAFLRCLEEAFPEQTFVPTP